MKILRKTITIVLSLMLMIMLTGTLSFAADSNKDDANLTYTITVYSGDSGTFADGTTVKRFKGLKYGDTIQLNITDGDLAPVINKDVANKYYARGFKIAGHDNDEISQLQLVNYNHRVEGDASFTVAYGMKGKLVKYTVYYQDADGNDLHDPEQYYGMAGDTPVVSYQYVEGWIPASYNIGQTLTEDESDNVFTFVYSQKEQTQNPDNDNNNNGNNNGNNGNDNGNNPANNPGAANAGNNPGAANAGNNAGANANANAGANNAADGTAIGDNAVPQGEPEQVTINDNDSPTTEPQTEEKTEAQNQRSMATIVAGACAVVLIGLLAFVLAKRRNTEEYDDEDDEE